MSLTPREEIPRITSLSEVERRIAKVKDEVTHNTSLSEQVLETTCKLNGTTLVYSMDSLYNLTPTSGDKAVVYSKATASILGVYQYNGTAWIKI